jgi:hypothetical protein
MSFSPRVHEDLDRALEGVGIPLTRDSLVTALGDPRADLRSLASLKLALTGTKADLGPLMRAWLAEEDPCTKFEMEFALGILVPGLALDPKQHPGGQEWVTPFQPCTPSQPVLVTLTVEQMTVPNIDVPTVRISARNHTARTLPFASGHPEQLYSVTVLDPTGAPAKIAKGREGMYRPVANGNGPVFLALPPQKDVPLMTWWRVGDDFDMSAPGLYHVSLGGRIGTIDSTVCSNVAEVRVER